LDGSASPNPFDHKGLLRLSKKEGKDFSIGKMPLDLFHSFKQMGARLLFYQFTDNLGVQEEHGLTPSRSVDPGKVLCPVGDYLIHDLEERIGRLKPTSDFSYALLPANFSGRHQYGPGFSPLRDGYSFAAVSYSTE
jgi:hypothetical protein